jgi:AGCS family alanine or glycine:cation symporter
MSDPTTFIETISTIIWGPHMLIFLVGTGIYLTVRLRFIQAARFIPSLRLLAVTAGRKGKKKDVAGDITPIQAFMTSLAGTVGNGNIAGVATAIAAGGPGALFWMWVSALFGMATKFSESLLGVYFREKSEDGMIAAGPMYYIRKGAKLGWLASIFALALGVKTLISTSMIQTNSMALAVQSQWGIPMPVTGLMISIMVWLVIIRGIKSIGRFSAAFSPFMVLLYLGGALAVILINYHKLPEVFGLILSSAFRPTAAIGGFAGAGVMASIRYGVARGVYSNEAGTGSSPIAHGAAMTDQPVRQGLFAMVDVFVDTIIICSVTGLAILVMGNWTEGLTSSELVTVTFENAFEMGGIIVVLGSLMFGFSTLISWPYYGEQCFSYLFGIWIKKPFRWIFCGIILLGSVLKVETIWNLADIFNGLQALPNLTGLLILAGLVVRETKRYIGNPEKRNGG